MTPTVIKNNKIYADGILYNDIYDKVEISHREYNNECIGKHIDYQNLTFEGAVARLKRLALEQIKYDQENDADYMEP